jgi:hypothetical protein
VGRRKFLGIRILLQVPLCSSESFAEELTTPHLARELAARFVIGFLQCQRLVVDEPARSREMAHVAPLLTRLA